MKRPLLLAAVAVFAGLPLWPPPTHARVVHHVDNIGTCEGKAPCYSTITDAVSAASPGDVIKVFPGVYREAVAFSSDKRDITLRAHDKDLKPVIAPPAGQSPISISASPGVKVLNFVLEATEASGLVVVGLASADFVIRGNIISVIRGNSISMPVGISLNVVGPCTLKDNTLRGGGIESPSGVHFCLIESNTVEGGQIALRASLIRAEGNVIRGNVVRGGGIILFGDGVMANTIESNFVSGALPDGIRLDAFRCCSGNVVQENTAIESARCDINDTSVEVQNTWTGNRFGTKCGAAAQ